MLTLAERATLRIEIARRLSALPYSEIDVILEEFGAQTSYSWDGDQFSYAASMIKGLENGPLHELSKYLNIEIGENSVTSLPSFWQKGKLKLFISHISKHKVFASNLQEDLARFGISAFVAHEDIEPTTEWQDEIEKALRTCDALVALLNPGFSESTWTDQEVGYALGRGVPVFSIRLGVSPYGLFGRKQAFNGGSKSTSELARELFDAYRQHPKTSDLVADTVIELFCRSGSFREARENCSLVEELANWKQEYNEQLLQAIEKNNQIGQSFGVPDRIRKLVESKGGTSLTHEGNENEIPF